MTSEPAIMMETFDLDECPVIQPTWNAAPTQALPVVRMVGQHKRVDSLRWGLVPPWSRDPKIGSRMINARSETAADKPSFRSALRQRRCVVVADGFYEWQRDGETKRPHCIRMREGHPFGMAGLWESWSGQDDEVLETFTILTTAPNELMAPIHDRMPVILPRSQHDRWLSPDLTDPGQVSCLLRPFDSDQMMAFEVSSRVNSPRNNDPDCMRPASEG